MANFGGLIFAYSLVTYTPTYFLTMLVEPTSSMSLTLKGEDMAVSEDGWLLVISEEGVIHFFDPHPNEEKRFLKAAKSLNIHEAAGYGCSLERVLWSPGKPYEIILAGENGIISFLQEGKGVHALRSSERASTVGYLRLLEGGMLGSMDREGEFCLWQLPKRWRDPQADMFEA